MNDQYWEMTHGEAVTLANMLAEEIMRHTSAESLRLYGVPRGGVPCSYLVAAALQVRGRRCTQVESPIEADVLVDDIYDSGATCARYAREAPGRLFGVLVSKTTKNVTVPHLSGGIDSSERWVVFPWEGTVEHSASDIVTRLIQFVGDDPTRGGLAETPKRVLKAWREWGAGYAMRAADVLKTFEDGADKVDEMVLVRDIPIYSHCEHHLAPFFGVAHIGYIPDGRIVGLSKLSRLADVFAKRLQVQERLTNQIADALVEHLQPKGVGVVVSCRHLCMESRGIQRQGATTITSAMRGVLFSKPEARAELMSLIK